MSCILSPTAEDYEALCSRRGIFCPSTPFTDIMRLKIITGFLILAVVTILFTAGCVDSKPTYTIGVDAAMSPWEYVDSGGNPVGINIDLIEMIAENQGFNVKYYVPENAEWEQCLVDGKIDTIGAVIITPEREQKYLFAEMPFEPTRYLVIARADSDLTLDDFLSGEASIAVADNSAYLEWIKNHFGMEKYNQMVEEGKIIIKVTADELAFTVLSHNADTAIAGTMTLGKQLNTYQSVKFIGFVGEPKNIGFILRQNETEFHKKLTDGLKELESTQAFADLIKEYNLQYRKNTYIVGVDADNSPWTYVGEDGNYTGFDVEMIQWIAEQNNFTVEFKPSVWKDILNNIITGEIDMAASSMSITNDRMRYAAFSRPYYTSGTCVAALADSNLTKKDFDSPTAAVATIYGTTHVSWLENYFGSELHDTKLQNHQIIRAVDKKEMLDALYSGKADFIVSGEQQISSLVDEGKLKIVYLDKNAEELGVAIGNGNYILQEIMNSGVEAFESSGKKAELLAKYGF